jgi:DNA transposition AAA+ family ATPase
MIDTIPDIPGARIVRTPAFDRIAAAVSLVTATGQTAVIHGQHGTGKRTATHAALATCGPPVHEIDLEPNMTSKDMVRRLHRAVIGHDDVSERDMQDDVIEALAATPRAVLIRRADRLTREASGQLHWLHENSGPWPLLLLGGPSTGAALDREAYLRGSVLQTVEVEPLRDRALMDALQAMHPLLLGAGVGLLGQIDQAVCRGVLRHWTTFLRIALHIQTLAVHAGNPAPVLDLHLARATIAQLPTTITHRKNR